MQLKQSCLHQLVRSFIWCGGTPESLFRAPKAGCVITMILTLILILTDLLNWKEGVKSLYGTIAFGEGRGRPYPF